MNSNRERLAWAILLLSFALCVGLVVGVPLGVRHVLRVACVSQPATLEPQRGTPTVQRRGRGEIFALIGPTWDVPPGTVVTTDNSAQVLLTLYAPGDATAAVAAVQIYGDTKTTLTSARSPRFGLSPLPHQVTLHIEAGRMRVSVAPAGGRNTVVMLHTPHLNAELNEGSYEIRVSPAVSELIAREGNALVTSNDGGAVILTSSQRTSARVGGTTLQVLPAERNLVQNGSFNHPLEEGWDDYSESQQPPGGSVEVGDVAGRLTARLHRSGSGWAEVGIKQTINYDVRDFTSLVLHLNVQVAEQSLAGCGSLGTECPIMVRIDYKDIYGTDRSWYHGFYSQDHIPPDRLYDYEQQIPFRTWVTFDSENLVETFEEPPALVKAVTIYASGHSFDALVTEIELLAQE